VAILITGGAGYVGRWLAHELAARGQSVVACDLRAPDPAARPELPASARFALADVTDPAALSRLTGEQPIGAIVHLAGVVTMACEQDPNLAMRVNLGGTHNVLEAARLNGVPRVVFASTLSVFGPDVPPVITEDTAAEPHTWYGQTKLLAEQLGLYYRRRWGLDFRAARMAAIVGPSRVAAGSATMYTSLIVERAALGEPYEIDVDPEAGVPVCYAKDAARALAVLAVAESVPRPIYNVSTGSATAQELIALVRRRVPKTHFTFKPDPQLAPVSVISRDWQVSVAAAERELGWRPAYTIETMVDDLIATVRNNGG
jgi:nucleoside-diphosphate-sugar epimerase